MKFRTVRRVISGTLLLAVSTPLAAAVGCGDDAVRGAGSINVPKPAPFEPSQKSAARRAGAAGNPHRPR